MNSTCDRDDSIKCQLPNGTQRAASTLRCRVPDDFWLVYPRITIKKKKKKKEVPKRDKAFFTSPLSRIDYCLTYIICIFVSICVLVLLPFAFTKVFCL